MYARKSSKRNSYKRASYGGSRSSVSRYGKAKKSGWTPKFATVGFSRNVEKKYHDKTYHASSIETVTGQQNPTNQSNGVTYISNSWRHYAFGGQASTDQPLTSNDMLKGLETGTTARTRIGNKMKVDYIKGAFTFTSATVTEAISEQGGEQVGTPAGNSARQQYLRTTFRFVIVKDLQVNSTDQNVTWPMVFDTTGLQAGVHSELNVDNMGRFIVLEDKIFTVDADSPQRTCTFNIGGSKVGHVRYNGPSSQALTDKGIYVVWAAFVMGFNGPAQDVALPSPVGHSRLCFNDD